MGLSLVTRPAVEPLTLDEALQQCRISDDIDNGLVAGYIIGARQFAEDFTRCALIRQTFDASFDWSWPLTRMQSTSWGWSPYYFYRTRIDLPRRPLISVQWVHYIDIDGVQQTLDPAQYMVVNDDTVPYIEPAFGVEWAATRYQPAAIQVRFDAGFGPGISDIPETIRHALRLLVAFWYDNRGSAQFGARGRIGAEGVVSTGIVPAEMPPAVVTLLSTYAVPRVLA